MRGQGKKLAQAARLWARGQLQTSTLNQSESDADEAFDEALAAFGLQRSEAGDSDAAAPDVVQDVFYLWPCNVLVFRLWGKLRTQWRAGPVGHTGLDYASVIAYMRSVARIPSKQWNDTFAGLQAMEAAALQEWAEMRD